MADKIADKTTTRGGSATGNRSAGARPAGNRSSGSRPASGRDRRATVEAMRRRQQAQERRKTLLFVGIAVLLGLGLVAAAVVPSVLKSINDPTKKDLAAFGVPVAQAGLDPEIRDRATGGQDHVAEGVRVDYKTAPPSSGRHDGNFLTQPLKFYTAQDRPPLEKLVHSLEHGYTVVWYDATVQGAQLKALQDIAARGAREPATSGKLIVTAWDDARGQLPAGKHVAMSHWGATQAWRQYSAQVSGQAVKDFITRHPASDAPEPLGV